MIRIKGSAALTRRAAAAKGHLRKVKARDRAIRRAPDYITLSFGEVRRLGDKAHFKFVASQPCLICRRSPTDAHHLRFTHPLAMGPRSATSSPYRSVEPITGAIADEQA
jgi:hypothetical protein